MGALIEAEGNRGKGTEKSRGEKLCTSSPVVYQLVRVGIDGKLVPATDDELMEVGHLLEDDKTQLLSVESQRHPEECHSGEWLLPNTSNVEDAEVDLQKSDARVEDDKLQFNCEPVSHSPKDTTVSCKSIDHHKHLQLLDDNDRPGNTSVEVVVSSTIVNASGCSQSESTETVQEPANDAVASRSPISEARTSSEPDFSILKGEICLDDLTMRELQEVFRVTFGRHTSVKDKLWLKRRITMGLTNSCEVPTTSIVIKDNKVVQEKMKEEPCEVQKLVCGTVLPSNEVSGSINENLENSSNSPTQRIKEEQVVLSKRLRKPRLEYDMEYDTGYAIRNENLQTEQCATKRARKPTKRFIEELSDVETRECSGRSVSSVKVPGHRQVSPKSQVRVLRDVDSQGTTFVTRKDSIGGFGMQIPYVSRMRRGRPRKDFCALMNFGGVESDERDAKISYSEEELDLDHEKMNPAGDSSENNDDTMHSETVKTLKAGKRKHHRAWTLSEVVSLVEGVARYGAGRWSEIRRVAFASCPYRTSVDLKDKWRNLIKASFAQDPSDKGARNFRKPTSVPIPTPILLRVRELAEMHSQVGIEFGPSKFASHGARIVQEKGSGFL